MKIIILIISWLVVCHATNAQNVGLGTISPTAKLHVNGSLKITNGSQGEGKVLTSDAAGLATWKVPEKSIFKATGFEATFNVAPDATKKLTDWKTVELNVGANSIFVNAQGDLFVLRDGFYRVSAKVTAYFQDPGDTHDIELTILINGIKSATSTSPVPTNDNTFDFNLPFVGVSVTSVFQLKSQDKISIEFYNDAPYSNTSARFNMPMIENRRAEFLVEQL